MSGHQKTLDRIDSQRRAMTDLVVRWADINSHTFNRQGLSNMANKLAKSLPSLGGKVRQASLDPVIDENGEACPLADTLIVQKRPEAPKQVLLVCHMDTVYGADHPFQKTKKIDDNTFNGPGITDAKGGIVVMLKAVEALEREPSAKNIGWTMIINSDEEIGSPSSAALLTEHAKRCQWGLVFEPCLDNGHLVGARKGSGNFALVAKGKAAHAGRNIDEGKNAINALAECLSSINILGKDRPGLTVNVGVFKGGTAQNVVAERAFAKINFRFADPADADFVRQKVEQIAQDRSSATGVEISVKNFYATGPKPLTDQTLHVLKHFQGCGKDIGLDIQWQDSGGVCDGNRLQAAGLPTVDTLGVRGGAIHSDGEYIIVDSLVERAKLSALALLKWADDEWSP